MNDGLSNSIQSLWKQFAVSDSLRPEQLEQFKMYDDLLQEWNEKINLTTIASTASIIPYHFQDSLRLDMIVDIAHCSTIVDVGTGGGFPGIPLAIKYPHLEIILIEVSDKKIRFLDAVITELKLQDRVSIFDKDWRTFLRTTDFTVDLFCARASLSPEELIRMFKPGCVYKDSKVVYWASKEWQPNEEEKHFIQKSVEYIVGSKTRKLVLFERP